MNNSIAKQRYISFNLFPTWKQPVSSKGTGCFKHGNNPFLTSGHMLAISLVFLMLLSGISKAWGQTDYSGTYYLNMIGTASYSVNPASNFYLCPTEEWCYYVYDEENHLDKVQANDNGQPFLTTYQCRDGKNDAKAKWIIQKHETENYYYIIYAKDSENQKYLTYNGILEGAGEDRVRVHLESAITGDNNLFAITKADGGYFLISSKNDPDQYLNVTDGNKKSYKGDTGKDDGPTGYKNVGGIIGRYYQDVNTSRFYLEIPRPTFKLIKESNVEKIEITEALEDVTIYYTTDGTEPVLPAAGEDPTEPTVKYTSAIPLNTKKQLLIKLIATNKDRHTVSTPIVTYVYTRDITWSETSFVYNGTAQAPTVTSVKIGDDVVPASEYKYSCSNNTNAGTATLTLTDKTVNNYIVDGYKNFTIQKAPLTIMADAKTKDYLDDDPELTFSVEGLQGADSKQVVVTKCELQRAAGEVVVEGGYAITFSETKTSNNYTGTFVPSTLTIQPKNFGTGGPPPSGISVYVEKNNDVNNPWSVSVYNGSRQFQASDFTYEVEEAETEGSYIVTVTGKSPNSTGSTTTPYTNFEFPIRVSDTERAAPYFTDEQDLKTSSDINPYIVNKVNPSVGTISITPISYIPKDVPVLLLADAGATGLTVSPMNEDVSISDVTLNNNKLMYSSEGTVTVAAAQAYIYYLGEFVLTTAGSIKQNRFYLYNPNYNGGTETPSDPEPDPAPARILKIIKNDTTGLLVLKDISNAENSATAHWYTLDGRRLSGKPTMKGLYIKNGKKFVIK